MPLLTLLLGFQTHLVALAKPEGHPPDSGKLALIMYTPALYLAHQFNHAPVSCLNFSNCKMMTSIPALYLFVGSNSKIYCLHLPWAAKWCGHCRTSLGVFLSFQIDSKERTGK